MIRPSDTPAASFSSFVNDSPPVIVVVGATPPLMKGSAATASLTQEKLGDATLYVLTLSSDGKHPGIDVDGDALVVGAQRVRYADGKLTLERFAKQ